MLKIAVIGGRETVMGFKALGLETYPTADVEEAKEVVRTLAKEECAVIYLTEQLAKDMMPTIQRYKDALRPAIILIPGQEGSLGIGQRSMESAVKRAIGTEI
jgi:V/A-type H+-transporting ATPase subunit F